MKKFLRFVGIILMGITAAVTLIVTALSVAREREAGTFDQLLVTPLRPVEILIGKSIPGVLVGLFQGSLIILIAVHGFGLPLHGSLGALYLGMALFLLSDLGSAITGQTLYVDAGYSILGI